MSRPESLSWKPYAALFTGVAIIGFSAIFTRWTGATGAVVSLYRMAIGTLVLAIPFAARWRREPISTRSRGFRLAVLAGLFFGLDLAAWSSGIHVGGATIPTLLANLAPVWVGVGAWLIFKERLKLTFWLGLTLALAGMFPVLNLSLADLQFGPGALFGLLAAFLYGIYQLIVQRGRGDLDTLAFFWIAAATSTLVLIILVIILGDPVTGYSTFSLLNFLALGVLVQGLGWMLINYSQGFLPASLVSPTLLIQPVITAIVAGPLLGETFSAAQWFGGLMVLMGIVVVYQSRSNHQEVK